jgi:hypothetical protein
MLFQPISSTDPIVPAPEHEFLLISPSPRARCGIPVVEGQVGVMVQTVRMSSRDEVDLVAIMSQAVARVLGDVLRSGELDEVMLSWGGEVQMPDGSRSTPTELRLVLVCVGEEFTMPIWTLGQDQFDLSVARDDLRDALQNFVAESRFGWGEQR